MLRESCAFLMEKFKQNKDVFELVLCRSYTALDGRVCFTSFGTKHVKLTLSSKSPLSVIYALYVESLKDIFVKSTGRLDWHHGFAHVLSACGATMRLQGHGINYTKLHVKVGLSFITFELTKKDFL